MDQGGIMYTLNSTEVHGVCYGIDLQGGKGNASYTIDKTATLRAQDHGHPPLICFEPRSQDGIPRIANGDVSPTLNTMRGGSGNPVL